VQSTADYQFVGRASGGFYLFSDATLAAIKALVVENHRLHAENRELRERVMRDAARFVRDEARLLVLERRWMPSPHESVVATRRSRRRSASPPRRKEPTNDRESPERTLSTC